MTDIIRIGRETLLFVASYPLGCFLAGVISSLWEMGNSVNPVTPSLIFGLALSYAALAWLPLIVVGFPAVFALKLNGASRLTATAVLTAGGALVGGLFMKATFSEFVRDGTTAGGSVGLVLGILLFGRAPAKA